MIHIPQAGPGLWCPNTSAMGQTQSAGGNRGACRQLPLLNRDYTACLSSHTKSCKEFSSETSFCLTAEIITRVDFLIENHIAAWMTKQKNVSTASTCVAPQENWSNAPQRWGTQHSKGHTIYLLTIFFHFFYITKTAILLSYLLLGLSYWDPERALYSAPQLRPQSRVISVHPLPPPAVNPPSSSLHKASQKGQKDLRYKEIEKYTLILWYFILYTRLLAPSKDLTYFLFESKPNYVQSSCAEAAAS